MTDPIEYTVHNRIGVLRVNRPQARNALNWEAQAQFAQVVDALVQDPRPPAALIITGTGDRAFVAGGDVKEHLGRRDKATGERLNRTMSAALDQLTRLPLPVIAAVNGDAYGGGCEIITACDLRLMRDGAALHFVQAKVGLTTGWGGAARLVRLLGLSRALELLLTARSLPASEAHAIGLVHQIVPPDADVAAEAIAWARRIAALPRDAVAALKQLAYAATEKPLAGAYALESELFVGLWGGPNHQEALRAFAERRPPRFNEP